MNKKKYIFFWSYGPIDWMILRNTLFLSCDSLTFGPFKTCFAKIEIQSYCSEIFTESNNFYVYFQLWNSIDCGSKIECLQDFLHTKGLILYLVFCHCHSHSHNAYQQCLPTSSVQSYRINIAKALWLRLRLWLHLLFEGMYCKQSGHCFFP